MMIIMFSKMHCTPLCACMRNIPSKTRVQERFQLVYEPNMKYNRARRIFGNWNRFSSFSLTKWKKNRNCSRIQILCQKKVGQNTAHIQSTILEKQRYIVLRSSIGRVLNLGWLRIDWENGTNYVFKVQYRRRWQNCNCNERVGNKKQVSVFYSPGLTRGAGFNLLLFASFNFCNAARARLRDHNKWIDQFVYGSRTILNIEFAYNEQLTAPMQAIKMQINWISYVAMRRRKWMTLLLIPFMEIVYSNPIQWHISLFYSFCASEFWDFVAFNYKQMHSNSLVTLLIPVK